MIMRYPAQRIVFILFSFFITYRAIAQPTLPDITGSLEKGGVLLEWNCQYSGIKAISVLRSADSINDYEIIGFVKKTDKGIQEFVDSRPVKGKNYYKLAVVFNSGLTWRSNHFGINVTRSELESSKRLPSNDSQQKIIVPEPIKHDKIERESDNIMPKKNATEDAAHKIIPDTCKVIAQKPRISLTFETDTSTRIAVNGPPRPKFTLKMDGPNTEPPIFIRSRYINTDSATGHINMFLPDDVATHHYSVKFYDLQNHLVTEVPRINTSKILIDKRNFQRKGVYKFILRRDYVELESGYIIINPTSNSGAE